MMMMMMNDDEEEENMLPPFVSGNKIISFCYRILSVTKFRTDIQQQTTKPNVYT
jgi:hypothetical protein